MAAIVFPQNPTVNDTCQADNSTWKFDGVRWRRLPSDVPLSRLSTDDAEIGDVLAFDGEKYSPIPPAPNSTTLIDGGDASLFQTSATYSPTSTYSSTATTTIPSVSAFTASSSHSFTQPFTSEGSTYSTSGYQTYTTVTATQTYLASTSFNFVSSTFLPQTYTTWYEI